MAARVVGRHKQEVGDVVALQRRAVEVESHVNEGGIDVGNDDVATLRRTGGHGLCEGGDTSILLWPLWV